jgi:hypothetical protein
VSEIGQQSGFYQELYEQAELIDCTLLELKEQPGSVDKPNTYRLGEMLVALTSEKWQESPARLLIVLLGDFSRSRRMKWAEIGEKLLDGTVPESDLTTLEGLAVTLEQEQTNVMARIKGL